MPDTGGESRVGRVDAAVLLAGGSSRRAGIDKRYLVLGGRTMLQRSLLFLRAIFPVVGISLRSGQSADLGDLSPAELIYDRGPGASPMVGIAAALAHYRRPVFVMASDIAFPDPVAAARLLAAFPGNDLALPVVGGRHEPLFAIYGPACLEPMMRLIHEERHSLLNLLPEVKIARVHFDDARPFTNVNTRQAFDEAREDLWTEAAAGAHRAAASALPSAPPALLAIVGRSNAGKTTLIERLVPELARLGLRVGAVKHDVHGFEIDHPGKDSWRYGQSGVTAYAVASPLRMAFVTELDAEMPLDAIATTFFTGFDLVLAEGYKHAAPHRVEVFRAQAGHEAPLCLPSEVLALVTDAPLEHPSRFELEDAATLAGFVASRLEILRRY